MTISRVCDVICAFLWFEVGKGGGDGFDERIECSRGSLSQQGFEFCEGLFDRVEVGTVGRQIMQARPGSLDRFLDAGDFVRWQIVHHDDVALAQGRREKMFDIGQETRAVHRPVEDARRCDLIATQGADERRRHPMSKRSGGFEAASARGAAIKPDHIRLCSRFVNKDKLFRVQVGLAGAPFLARLGDIGAVLFGGAQ